MNTDEKQPRDDKTSLLASIVAAAVLIPIGIWLKSNYADQVGYMILSLGGTLY